MSDKGESALSGYTFGYRRVSSVQQSYERQTAALLDAGLTEERIFEDKISGKHENRPGYQALLKQVRPGDEIVVSSLDRFGRTALHILQTIDELKSRGVRVRSLKPGEQFEGITGELILTIMAAIAEWERLNILERAADARAAKKARGVSVGRAKTATNDDKVAAVRALRESGKTVDYIVKNQKISRASVYRALGQMS